MMLLLLPGINNSCAFYMEKSDLKFLAVWAGIVDGLVFFDRFN
jgi:hypothetical protein